ncbi:MAG: NAD(P)H-dependent oxidoreductase [Methylicorpusculum sp.]|uniref:FMN-dependent NADH-azoreductase n=1 Tax=Methylicorpusculum sp. TaxID=2713644 RepID=UPI00271EF86C|nr:NAD(P)H-dependent oxidoreductase [Methylicorpusculum sp.]MDO8940936.1 NAD(P)H-dependent oxidoreductase [Methylicorpusculum sp.]MDO9241097.1 NAD(P)H-dependent oxidoreductase [Methylicorpusculum sp.]MDP2180030.1 NAD(P)H-dependent oxidoreductase [Methylicorpusculum sp.]MDP2202827.1 NAD(P)H-dependent oxidoreductase [Methylicorpusculum sp.]MDP3528670.1 NAD(P)H-dependent oxidoreductase [Methylicorpusculum sp.]
MTTLLQINSSLFSSGGHSSQLANDFVAAWRAINPDAQVKVRDLATEPLPHLDAQRVSAFFASPDTRTPEQQILVNESNALINEIKESDLIVIGLPMYNFGIPSTLKAYFDQIARAGLTFRYTENGPEGLLAGKKAFIFATRGGMYAGTALDSQTTYVRDFLNFLGITDVEFIYAEGLNMGEETKDQALAKAHQRLAELVI